MKNNVYRISALGKWDKLPTMVLNIKAVDRATAIKRFKDLMKANEMKITDYQLHATQTIERQKRKH